MKDFDIAVLSEEEVEKIKEAFAKTMQDHALNEGRIS